MPLGERGTQFVLACVSFEIAHARRVPDQADPARPVAMQMPGRLARGRFVGAVVRRKCGFYDGLEIVVRWVIDLLNSRSLSR